jgi:hypothetical protein
MAKAGKQTRSVLKTVGPNMGEAILEALEAAPDWLDFSVISGRRTREEQQDLWFQGRNEDGDVVDADLVVTFLDGIILLSSHQDRDGTGYGEAVDIAAFVGGRPTWDKLEVVKRAAYIVGFLAARGITVTGGVKWGWDEGHLEEA